MNIRWRPAAAADLDGIIEYIARDNPVAAIELGDRIEARVRGLPRNPKLYREGRVHGTREMVVHPHYVVVYRLSRSVIDILRVLHTSRQWPPARVKQPRKD